MSAGAPGPCVVYLARAADGIEALRRFAASYARHPAGTPHRLIVAFKGFVPGDLLDQAQAVFAPVAFEAFFVDDVGFDIGSYVKIANGLDTDILCFLNTHSELRSDGWLAKLLGVYLSPGVGLAGAMGSYESIATSVPILEKVIRRADRPFARRNQDVCDFFDFLLLRIRPDWYARHPAVDRRHGAVRKATQSIGLEWSRTRLARNGLRGTALIWPGAPEIDVSAFDPFPNPHLRTNGFMIARDLFLSVDISAMMSKGDANLFESGRDGLTKQVMQRGGKVLVAGDDGRGYDMPDWPRSRTFRLGDQGNLLLSDNHTRAFDSMSAAARTVHTHLTWGGNCEPLASGLPALTGRVRRQYRSLGRLVTSVNAIGKDW